MPTPARSESLEARLQRAEALLQVSMPGLDLDNPLLQTASPSMIVAAFQNISHGSPAIPRPALGDPPHEPPAHHGADDGALLETMMENFGSMNIDDRGNWDYRGHSSVLIFMQRLQNQFGDLITPSGPYAEPRQAFEDPNGLGSDDGSQTSSDCISGAPPTSRLPAEAVAKMLCRHAFDHACVLMRVVHEPSFWSMFQRIYTVPWDRLRDTERNYLPQLYAVVAIGCLTADDAEKILNVAGLDAVLEHGYVTHCRSLRRF